jgi:hypothetical protein
MSIPLIDKHNRDLQTIVAAIDALGGGGGGNGGGGGTVDWTAGFATYDPRYRLKANPVPWAEVDKAGSSLAHLAIRNIADTTGTVQDARLSANIPRLDAAQNNFLGTLLEKGFPVAKAIISDVNPGPAPEGTLWIEPGVSGGGGGGGTIMSVFGRTDPHITALSSDYAAHYAPLSHTHSAGAITAGTFGAGSYTFPSSLYAGAGGGSGRTGMVTGTPSQVGYFEWFLPNGSRQAFMGWEPGYLFLNLESVSRFVVNGNMEVGGYITSEGHAVAKVIFSSTTPGPAPADTLWIET